MKENYDVIIVGTGAAGLYCALNLPSRMKVLMLTKQQADQSDSFLAQGDVYKRQVLIVIVLLGFALKGSIKHFKGESPCCGGGGGEIVLDIPDKKLENPILGKKVLKISGMHCEHCVKAVTEAINKIDGAAAKVNLSENDAVVSYDRELDEDVYKRQITSIMMMY